ncbi:MAG: transglycosylase SLT domain-containing protein, partial [Chitinivibrionales bacterium]
GLSSANTKSPEGTILDRFSLYELIGFLPEKDYTGIKHILSGSPDSACSKLLESGISGDTAFYYFKLGIAGKKGGMPGRAKYFLLKSASLDSMLTPVAYELIGDIEAEHGRLSNAVVSYRSALSATNIPRYRYYLYEKMYSFSKEHPDTLADVEWLCSIFREPEMKREERFSEILKDLISDSKWDAVDSIVEENITKGIMKHSQYKVSEILISADIPDSLFSTQTIFSLSKLSYEYGKYRHSSDWLHKALNRDDFSKAVNSKDFIWHRANLNYRLGNYNNALSWFKKYQKKYGLSPENVYLTARCYRYLGKRDKAALWYDRHIEKYPSHSKSFGILWYGAWQKEDEGDMKKARKLYKKIYSKKPNWRYSDNSMFRYALTYYKQKMYHKSIKALNSFLKKYPSSHLSPGAKFWVIKSYYVLREEEKLTDLTLEMIDKHPFSYYTFKAAELLKDLGKEVEVLTIDTLTDPGQCYDWFKGLSKDRSTEIPETNRYNIRTGFKLALCGLTDHADFLLEPHELKYSANLSFQLRLSLLYYLSKDPARSFRIAKELYRKVPSSKRREIPLLGLLVMYPCSYWDIIFEEAEKYGIEEELLLGIIRQESMFDAQIVSPAGAMGLMQIMSYTGKDIAVWLKDEFSLESLYFPIKNIEYGTYYINHLLDKFNGEMVPAIASYNGGPHNVERWIRRNRDDGPDMFVEDIGYTETRNYVKKVLANYRIYKALIPIVDNFSKNQ